jgi:hypothetical protein
MKILTIVTFVGVGGLAVLSVAMAKTNPNQAQYEQYAAQRLTEYLKSDVCAQTPNLIQNIVRFNCSKFVESARPQIREIIGISTQRQDFLVFSIYRTEFKLNSWVPSYKFETVGALENFYTYSAQQQ